MTADRAPPLMTARKDTAPVELGDPIGPRQRTGPDARQIAAYAGGSDIRERFFHEPDYARALGFPGLVVPGPLLSAFIEQFLRRELPGWRLERLSVNFRQPTTAGEVLTLRGVVVERHEVEGGVRIVCDVVIEHADRERAITGTATLWRGHGA